MTDVLQIQIRILVQSLLWCCFSLLIFTPCTTADPVILSLLLLIKGNQGYTDFLEAKYKEEKKKVEQLKTYAQACNSRITSNITNLSKCSYKYTSYSAF